MFFDKSWALSQRLVSRKGPSFDLLPCPVSVMAVTSDNLNRQPLPKPYLN